MEPTVNQKTWRAIQRADKRHRGMVNILRFCKRAAPQIDDSARGVFSMQQKHGI